MENRQLLDIPDGGNTKPGAGEPPAESGGLTIVYCDEGPELSGIVTESFVLYLKNRANLPGDRGGEP